MTWFLQLRRRLSALLGWLRRQGRPAEAPALPATPAETSTAAGPVAVAPVTAAPAAAEAVVEVAAAEASVVAAPVAAAPVAKPSRAAPPAAMDPSLAQLKARQFFARMIAATPAGLTVDFGDWRSASVERFFLAMSSPGLIRRREVPTSGAEQVSLTNAFQDFEWD